jgi:hypothetical protein
MARASQRCPRRPRAARVPPRVPPSSTPASTPREYPSSPYHTRRVPVEDSHRERQGTTVFTEYRSSSAVEYALDSPRNAM